jgi:hypothetical protein
MLQLVRDEHDLVAVPTVTDAYIASGVWAADALGAAIVNAGSVVQYVDTQTGLLRKHETSTRVVKRREQYDAGSCRGVPRVANE